MFLTLKSSLQLPFLILLTSGYSSGTLNLVNFLNILSVNVLEEHIVALLSLMKCTNHAILLCLVMTEVNLFNQSFIITVFVFNGRNSGKSKRLYEKAMVQI